MCNIVFKSNCSKRFIMIKIILFFPLPNCKSYSTKTVFNLYFLKLDLLILNRYTLLLFLDLNFFHIYRFPIVKLSSSPIYSSLLSFSLTLFPFLFPCLSPHTHRHAHTSSPLYSQYHLLKA